jgi:dihydroorotate dehydrogenase (fumarate)
MALTGGVHGATDVVKATMAGAKVAMMTSALLKKGISYLDNYADRVTDLAGRPRIRFD